MQLVERERERESKTNPTNYTPLIIGLAVTGLVLLLIFILARIRKKKK